MKVIDQLRTNIIGYKTPEPEPLKYIKANLQIDDISPNRPIYKTEAVLRVEQIGNGEGVVEDKYIRRQAAIMVADELYGEVIDELRAIMHDIYKTGPYYNPKIKDKIASLLKELTIMESF